MRPPPQWWQGKPYFAMVRRPSGSPHYFLSVREMSDSELFGTSKQFALNNVIASIFLIIEIVVIESFVYYVLIFSGYVVGVVINLRLRLV